MNFGITCYGLKTIETKLKNIDAKMDIQRAKDRIILKELEEVITEYNPEKIVIGMPYNENGTSGDRVEQTKKLIHKIKCKFNIEIVEQDERYTSIEASQIMNEIGIKKKKKRKVIDQIAAVLILEGYLKNLKKHK
ncbi:MAG: Holliday junction resolvase RuvX [Clostridiales bacterium]|nr:Holliday junction resolvase RuvX [Clostridiales bacterium]